MCHLGWGQTEAPCSMTQLWSFQSMCPASGGAACVSTSSTKSMFKYLQLSQRLMQKTLPVIGALQKFPIHRTFKKISKRNQLVLVFVHQDWTSECHCRIWSFWIQGTGSSELEARKGYFWHQQSQLPPLQYPMQQKWWRNQWFKHIQIIFPSSSKTSKQSGTPLQKWQRHRCEQANTASHAELCRTFHLHNDTLSWRVCILPSTLTKHYCRSDTSRSALKACFSHYSAPQRREKTFQRFARDVVIYVAQPQSWGGLSCLQLPWFAIMCMCNPILPWWSKGDCQVLVVPEFVWKAQSYSSLAPKCLVEQNVRMWYNSFEKCTACNNLCFNLRKANDSSCKSLQLSASSCSHNLCIAAAAVALRKVTCATGFPKQVSISTWQTNTARVFPKVPA